MTKLDKRLLRAEASALAMTKLDKRLLRRSAPRNDS